MFQAKKYVNSWQYIANLATDKPNIMSHLRPYDVFIQEKHPCKLTMRSQADRQNNNRHTIGVERLY
eukprot:scaffold227715_cov20-Prasinocladus_malaysianus.AAC.1